MFQIHYLSFAHFFQTLQTIKLIPKRSDILEELFVLAFAFSDLSDVNRCEAVYKLFQSPFIIFIIIFIERVRVK